MKECMQLKKTLKSNNIKQNNVESIEIKELQKVPDKNQAEI